MDIKKLFSSHREERAVSPVIGVILMVAITVILAAVIGAFVIGIGEDQEVQPTASFDFNFESDEITVTHSTGDTINQPDQLEIVIDGEREDWLGDESETNDDEVESVSGGNTAQIFPEGPAPDNLEEGQYEIELSEGEGNFNNAIDIDDSPGEEEDYEFIYDGETVSVVWTSESGDSSSTLSSQDAPN